MTFGRRIHSQRQRATAHLVFHVWAGRGLLTLLSVDTLNAMKARRAYSAEFVAIDGWWAAKVVEVPGVVTQGRTLAEAEENLQDALQQMLELLQEDASTERNEHLGGPES